MIKRKLILDNAPSNMGEQVHVNHEDCPAGVDKKRRLYIKRTEKGLVAYCHHCCEHGFIIDNDHSRLATWITGRKTSVTASKYEPVLTDLSPQGRIWLNNNWISGADTSRYMGVVGDPNKVAMPLFGMDGEQFGTQYRNLKEQPKYITTVTNNSSDAAWFRGSSTDTVVITEDYLSAHRVSLNSPEWVTSIALLRTTITDKTLIQITELVQESKCEFPTVIVWLDNDDAGLKGSGVVHDKLDYFLPERTLIYNYSIQKEPKHHTPAELHGFFK